MKTFAKLLINGLLAAGLTACDGNPVEVSFAQPFPVGAADAAGFAPRDQGQYVAATDTTRTLLVSHQRLLERRFETEQLSARALDSLGLPRQTGRARDGRWYQVQALAADSFRLRWQHLDTLAELGPGPARLRRYRGWYYLSAPADSGTWTVERLALVGRRLHWQQFNRDSLRIRVLEPSAVQLTRDRGRLLFALNPQPGRATRQVNSYDGLWLDKGEYVRKKQ